MVIRRNSKHDSNPRRSSKSSQAGQQRERRQLFLENLEDRRLLHGGGQHVPVPGAEAGDTTEEVAGFELAGAQVDSGFLLSNGDRLEQAPRDITLHFGQGVEIDPATLTAINLLRPGGDGVFGSATATTDFGTNGAVEVSFTSQLPGESGNGIQLVFTRSDHGNGSGPYLNVEDHTGHAHDHGDGLLATITLDLNTNEENPTTVEQIVGELSASPEVQSLLLVELVDGDPETDVSGNATDYSPVLVEGSDDEIVEAGYLGVEARGRDVIFRFRESLQDDLYRLVVNGGGAQPLRDIDGVPFLGGQADEVIEFTIDRGPQVVAVVPQPVTRDEAGILTQQRDQVHVYFNEDDLNSESAANPGFYQLIFTNDTLVNSDDVIHNPTTVEYDAATDRAVLSFAQPLDQLSGHGAYRLRVGDASLLPEAPLAIGLNAEAASTFAEALSIGKNLEVNTNGELLEDGQSLELVAESGQSLVLEFDAGLLLQLDSVNAADGNHFTLHHGSGASTFEFDGDATVGSGNIAIALDPSDDVDALAGKITLAIHAADMGLFPTDMGGGLIHLGGDNSTSADTASTIDLVSYGSPGVSNPGAIAVGYRPEVAFTSNDVAAAIVAAVESVDAGVEMQRHGNRIAVAGANVVRNTNITVVGDVSVISDGDVITVDDGDGQVVNLEIDTGVVIDASGSPQDGDTFTVTSGGVTKTFEVEIMSGISDAAHIPVFVGSGYDVGIVNAIDSEFGDLSPQAIGNGKVAVDLDGDYSIDLSGAPSLTSEGESGVTSGNVAVPVIVSAVATPAQVAAAISAGVNASGSEITAEADGARISLGHSRIAIPHITISLPVQLSSVFQLSADIEVVGLDSMILGGVIDPQKASLRSIGGGDEPGHRDIRVQEHLHHGADSVDGVPTLYYSFPVQYGQDPSGNTLLNAITEKQKQRAREIFELYSAHLGVQFMETDNLGLQVVTGDMRALDPTIPIGPGGVLGVASHSMAIMDLQDFDSAGDDVYGGAWFQTAIHEVGHMLGLGHTDELGPYTIMNDEPALYFGQAAEQVFVGGHDLVHGQFLHQPESNDIDIYELDIIESGVLSIEILAERLGQPSTLDSVITVYRDVQDGDVVRRELVARNDDYFSEDSHLKLDVESGHYYIGVSSTGNDSYDPNVADSGANGTTEGAYDLRLSFSKVGRSEGIMDATGNALDGDSDGLAGGSYNFWFNVNLPADVAGVGESRTIFVDKVADAAMADGTLANPFAEIDQALAAANSGDIVRVVANGGADGDLGTVEDNLAYQVGFDRISGAELADGSAIVVPQGVTLMVDSGVVVKSRRGRVAVGSSSPLIDNSDSALQVLGVPRVVDADGNLMLDEAGNPVSGMVVFTSLHDDEHGVSETSDVFVPEPARGDWGGIDIRNDIDQDRDDRFLQENEGIFLNHIGQAKILYGGGSVLVDGVVETVGPISLRDARPTIANNVIMQSAQAAITATPDSFEETNFNASLYQATPFTIDYDRVGPAIHGNTVSENSINGLFVSVATPAGDSLEEVTVSSRWDDNDIVHVVAENLVIAGTPGGHVVDAVSPPVNLVTLSTGNAGSLFAGTYNYRLVYVDAAGNESTASIPTADAVTTGANGSVTLVNLPQSPAEYVARRIYRSSNAGTAPYTLVAEINTTTTSFEDDGSSRGNILRETDPAQRPRLDASLVVDPSVIVKLDGARIDVGLGAQLIAEGHNGQEVIFTSIRDSRFGAGGSFDTSLQGEAFGPQAGDWAGVFAEATSELSLDHVRVAFGGGDSKVEGGFASFNVIEVQQAEARIANSVFEQNANGIGVAGDRVGRGTNDDAVIFIRGSEAVVISNMIINSEANAINIDADSLNAKYVEDGGRQTQGEMHSGLGLGNQGALIRGNFVDYNAVNGMVVRGGTLTNEGVWDDTDIVHVVLDTVYVADFHSNGGLRLESSPTESLVVKLMGQDAGFTATGRPLDIDDRIGGAIQIVGQPKYPVHLTSLNDCSVGAGYATDGFHQVETIDCYIRNKTAPTGNSGAVVLDGGDRDDHGQALAGPDGQAGTADDINQDGWLFIQQLLEFAIGGARNNAPNDILAVGMTQGTWAADALESAAVVNGYNITYVTGAQISSVNLEDYKMFYVPSAGFNVGGGISQADVDLLAARKLEIQSYVNSGGSHVALTGDGTLTPYAWLELPLPFEIESTFDTLPLRKTPEGIAAGFTISDVELSNGVPYHNSFIGPQGFNGLEVFVKDTGGDLIPDTADDKNITIGIGSGSFGFGTLNPSPGDWNGVVLETNSHDRNVDVAVESEVTNGSVGNVTNDTINRSQYLGALAPSEYSGDDNLRLGFEIHGLLEDSADVDTYSFTGIAGTEVWLDIDNTSASLDSLLRLVDSSGSVIAQSDNSAQESENPSLLISDSIPAEHVNPLDKSQYEIHDHFTTNVKDAGMRVILPGIPGMPVRYHIQVASANAASRGNYELQIRLREMDEVPGSTLRHSSISYGTTGLTVSGSPAHSPLAGEVGESSTTNDTAVSAQALGNLLTSDRATISVAGDVSGGTDVDFYTLDIAYDSVQSQGTGVAAMLDVDYADGLARANTTVSVFDSAGNLILVGRDSNIADDRPAPLEGTDLDDLNRGSVGPLDAFIGTIELPVDETGSYSIAISANTQVPEELEQFFDPAADNPTLRLEPVNSVVRIAEDHIDSSVFSTADAPIVPVLIDSESMVPYHLGDVALFVTTDDGLNQTGVYTIDAFTGVRETTVHNVAVPFETGDMAIRPDGNMFAFTTQGEGGALDDDTAGNYIQIDTGDGSVVNVGDDDVETRQSDAAGANQASDHGIHYDAMTYGTLQGALQGFVVGHRPNVPFPGATPDAASQRNILYRFNPLTGEVTSAPQGDRTGNGQLVGANTDKVERGILDTSVDDNGLAGKWLLGSEATTVDVITGLTTSNLLDGAQFSIDDGNPLTADTVFEFNSGPEVFYTVDPAAGIYVRDGDTILLDGTSYEFDTGEVLVVDAANGNAIDDGLTVSLTDDAGTTLTFEFDKNGSVAGSNISVDIVNGNDQEELALALVTAINDAAFNMDASVLTAGSNRISLRNTHSLTGASISGVGLSVDGDIGSVGGGSLIAVEENSTMSEFAAQLRSAFMNIATITPGIDGQRINFSGATVADFSELVSRGVFADQGSDGNIVDPTAVSVSFLAEDTADDIAQKAMNAIATAGFTVTASGGIVEMDPTGNALFAGAQTPLRVGGGGPGGDITGLAFIGSQMYAVSDAGGFYRVIAPMSANAQLEYIGTSAAALQGINFAGLTAGPVATEDGRYRDMLFGVDQAGVLYAFDTDGVLQPVLLDGVSSIQTGASSIEGIHFGTLEENPWDITLSRGDDVGHGINSTYDLTRSVPTPGSASLHFGSGTTGNIDHPGGAHGTVESNEFSLIGYSPEDQPMLYYTYFLATEDTSAVTDAAGNVTSPALDTFRVFVGDDSGQWMLLSTNNETDDPTHDFDEIDNGQGTQVGFDNTGNWRQVRVDLSEFAGRDHLKLRFDFSTAGSMNVGDSLTTGDELRTLPGRELVDGLQVVVDGKTLELDLGYTLVAPTGSSMVDGMTFSVDYGAGVNGTFEIDKDGASLGGSVISVNDNMTAEEVAIEIESTVRTGTALPNVVTTISSALESNDDLTTAIPVNLNGLPGTFVGNQGSISDNPNLLVDADLDVDLFALSLSAGDTITVDTDSDAYATAVNTYLRIFDDAGIELASNENAPAPGEDPSTDSYLEFTAPADGNYYVGVSGSGNFFYDPTVAESGVAGSVGSYDIEISISTAAGIVQRVNNRVNLPGAVSVVDAGTGLTVEGAAGVSGDATAILLHAGMSAEQVAGESARALNKLFAGGNADVFKTHQGMVRVIGHDVEDSGPFGLTTSLTGDAYGAFNSNVRGQNNLVEGVYVDDIIIGFAERGEMATGAAANTAYIANLEADATGIDNGEYQLEVRRGTQYVDYDVDGNAFLIDSYDTNDRLGQQINLASLAGHRIVDGQTFDISDGINTVTFEYDDITVSGGGVTPGNLAVEFNASESSVDLARRIRDLINSPAVQSTLDITASLTNGVVGDGDDVNNAIDDVRIALFGPAVVNVVDNSLVVTETTTDANQLRDALLGAGIMAVGDAEYIGGDLSAGLFEGGKHIIGIDTGILLTTGSAMNAEGTNASDGSTGISSDEGDLDLNDEFGEETFDSTVLEFDFEVEADSLYFNFVFASEEYNEFVNTDFNDVFAFFLDGENIGLVPGTTDPVSIDTINGGNPLGAGAQNSHLYVNNDPSDNGEYLQEIGYDGFTRVLTAVKTGLTPGQHRIKLAIADVGDTALDSAVFIQAGSFSSQIQQSTPVGIYGESFDLLGDDNTRREQGQIVIQGNRFAHNLVYGIDVDSATRNGNVNQGPVRNLREVNSQNLLPGVTVTNNVVTENADGLRIAGESVVVGEQVAAVPFARVVNNTFVGTLGAGNGVVIEDNASPTLLNNIFSDLAVGVSIDGTSESTVIGGSLYHQNGINVDNGNVGLGSFVVQLDDEDALFVNPFYDNYYLAPGSAAIDSSINTLQDRDALTTVKQPLGIASSPILAPETDHTGQKRVDDPTVATPSGLGQNVFKDRGAIDRADFSGPNAILQHPEDNDQAGVDRDAVLTEVELRSQGLDYFSIQLIDGIQAVDLVDGSGVDDLTVRPSSVTLSRDGVRYEYGVDYTINYDRTNDVIRFTPLSGRFESDARYELSIANEDGFVIGTVEGSQISDGESFALEDSDGTVVTFEYDSGYSFIVDPSFTLEIPEEGGSAIVDGEIFTVSLDGVQTDFEFDRNGVTQAGSEAVQYSLADDQDEIAASVLQALVNADIELEPVDLGDGQVMLGSHQDHLLDTTLTTLSQLGIPSSVNDGDTFEIRRLSASAFFEFDSDGILDNEDAVAITFSQSDSNNVLAENISDAINDVEIDGIVTAYYPDSLVHIGGDVDTHVDADNSVLSLVGRPGTSPGYGLHVLSLADSTPLGLADGQQFTIADGRGDSVRFEFDSDDIAQAGSQVIPFDVDTDVNLLGRRIVEAIELADIGLRPVYVGGGDIELHDSLTTHTIDSVGTPLVQLGVPGDEPAVAITYTPSEDFTAEMTAVAVAQSINNDDALMNVSADAIGDGVLVTGIIDVTGGNYTNIIGVKDKAGNPIQPNREDGSVAYTIVLTSGLDYGDAPDPDYPTLSTSGGATHLVIDGYQLGAENDTEPEAQANLDATGDTADDGVEFTQMLIRGGIGNVIVTAAGITPAVPGYLDAWVDFDRDGDWDADEKVIENALLENGSNALNFDIANDASIGTTYARFRLSSEGHLDSTGPAMDGEVEDYQVTIHRSGWQNPAIAEDVNQDGHVSPIDALLVINHLNSMDPSTLGQPLPVPESGNEPPPFLDVDGDNRVAPIDALMVINRISQSINAGAEGEFVPEVLTATSRSSVGALTVVHDVAEIQQQDAERAREQQFTELSTRGLDLLDDVLSEIAGDVQTEADDLDEFFANLRFE